MADLSENHKTILRELIQTKSREVVRIVERVLDVMTRL